MQFLRIGVLGGLGSASSAYQFTTFPIPGVGSNGSTYRYGAFVGGVYPIGRLLLSADATFIRLRTEQDYDPGNIPPSTRSGASLALFQIGASYAITPQLRVSAGAILNQVLSQQIAPGELGLDKNWVTLRGGISYALNEQWEVTLKGATWLANKRTDYSIGTIGVSYKF